MVDQDTQADTSPAAPYTREPPRYFFIPHRPKKNAEGKSLQANIRLLELPSTFNRAYNTDLNGAMLNGCMGKKFGVVNIIFLRL
jgi:hypothetical protein